MGSPVYIQIHNQLRENIENDKWRVGQKIPAERELASQFNVSRMTLRQAIQALVDEGILERRVGSGTFVANRKVQEKMAGVTSFTELMLAAGKTPSSKTISYHLTVPSQTEIEKLKLPAGEQVLRMERVRKRRFAGLQCPLPWSKILAGMRLPAPFTGRWSKRPTSTRATRPSIFPQPRRRNGLLLT